MSADGSTTLQVSRGARVVDGTVDVPGDKSIGHRAVLFGALCDGPVRVEGLSGGEDNRSTVAILRALGVRLVDAGPGVLEIAGVGLAGLRPPSVDLDCGNSGTSMRLCAGLLAAQPFSSRLVGDVYLHRRPMMRVVAPLRRMGARIDGQLGPKAEECYPPLDIAAATDGLRAIEHTSRVASAQVKSAILIAGLWAEGATSVSEPEQSRDHTERMLTYLGAPLTVSADHKTARIDPSGWSRRLSARPLRVPGDLSSAAFMLGAAAISDGGRVTVRDVGVNPTRTGVLDVMRAMGARLEIAQRDGDAVEPTADLTVRGEGLRGVEIAGELTVRAIDELPLIAVLAACAEGTTRIRDAAELRVKESDRIATSVAMLRAFGVDVEEHADGMTIVGGGATRAAVVESHGDHRIAMAAAILASRLAAPSTVRDVANIATSFPGFTERLRAIGVDVRG